MILQYALLACGLFALVGGLIMMGTARPDDGAWVRGEKPD